MLAYLTFDTTIELICFIIALVCLRHRRSGVWHWLIPFLLITVCAEMLGIHMWKEYRFPNAWIYNFLMLLQALIFISMFRQLLYPGSRAIPLITVGAAIFIVVYIADTIQHRMYPLNDLDFDGFNSRASTTLGILVVFYSLYYFYRLLNEEINSDLTLNSSFWWVAGSLFFYFGSLFTNIFYDLLSQRGISTYLIYNVLIFVLYGSWCYAFILKRWVEPALNN